MDYHVGFVFLFVARTVRVLHVYTIGLFFFFFFFLCVCQGREGLCCIDDEEEQINVDMKLAMAWTCASRCGTVCGLVRRGVCVGVVWRVVCGVWRRSRSGQPASMWMWMCRCRHGPWAALANATEYDGKVA